LLIVIGFGSFLTLKTAREAGVVWVCGHFPLFCAEIQFSAVFLEIGAERWIFHHFTWLRQVENTFSRFFRDFRDFCRNPGKPTHFPIGYPTVGRFSCFSAISGNRENSRCLDDFRRFSAQKLKNSARAEKFL